MKSRIVLACFILAGAYQAGIIGAEEHQHVMRHVPWGIELRRMIRDADEWAERMAARSVGNCFARELREANDSILRVVREAMERVELEREQVQQRRQARPAPENNRAQRRDQARDNIDVGEARQQDEEALENEQNGAPEGNASDQAARLRAHADQAMQLRSQAEQLVSLADVCVDQGNRFLAACLRRVAIALRQRAQRLSQEQEGEPSGARGEIGEGVSPEDQIFAELVMLLNGRSAQIEQRLQGMQQHVEQLLPLLPALRELQELRASERRLRNAVGQLETAVRRLEARLDHRQRDWLYYLCFGVFGGVAGALYVGGSLI